MAVELPGEVKEALERDVVEVLRPRLPGARWTALAGRHLTVKFLGEVDEARVESIHAAVSRAAGGHSPFEIALRDVGGFPDLRRPRVVWVGLGEGVEPLTALANDVEEALEGAGFRREARPYSAHLTLARFKAPAAVGELPAVTVPAMSFSARELTLFQSVLKRTGAVYTPVRAYPL